MAEIKEEAELRAAVAWMEADAEGGGRAESGRRRRRPRAHAPLPG